MDLPTTLRSLGFALVVSNFPFPVVAAATSARPQPYLLAPDDRIRLAEANRLRHAIGNRAWPSWSVAPFGLLLITDSVEFLFWHPHPSSNFVSQGYDSLLGTEVFARPRQFATNLLATFPAVDQTPTIVTGQPANTGKNSTEWVLTVLHEHFHQLQFARPGYYGSVDTLGLARGDRTGMWMLNYPFPYDSLTIQRLTSAVSTALADALNPTEPAIQAMPRLTSAAYDSLRAALSPDDRRYLDFQLWQEGVARYVEYRCALLAVQADAPSPAFIDLPDRVSYAAVAERLFTDIVQGLHRSDLKVNRRTSFYALGAGLALLLDRMNPTWKEHYFETMFTLAPHVQAGKPPQH